MDNLNFVKEYYFRNEIDLMKNDLGSWCYKNFLKVDFRDNRWYWDEVNILGCFL